MKKKKLFCSDENVLRSVEKKKRRRDFCVFVVFYFHFDGNEIESLIRSRTNIKRTEQN